MPINAIIVGLGIHGRRIAELAADAGVHLSGAADPAHAGTVLADLLPAGGASDLVVAASFAELDDTAVDTADIVIVAAQMPHGPLIDLIVGALERGRNVLTIVEQLFEPTLLDPADRERIDAAARSAGVTFAATGAQDVVWSGVVAHLTGAVRELRAIEIVQRLGVDGYPEPFVRGEVGAGTNAETFAEVEATLRAQPPVLGGILPLLARQLGLHGGAITRTITPVATDVAMPSQTFGRDLEPGEYIGSRDECRLDTAEGITISATLETTALPPGEGNDVYTARIDAIPAVTLQHEMDPGPENVNAIAVHRIGHVIAARPGLVSVDKLPMPVYRPSVVG